MNKTKKVYICSRLKATPFKTMKQHQREAASYCRIAWEEGYTPIAPHIYFPTFMNDNDPAERERACAAGLEEMKACDELWLFAQNGISEGMEAELKEAEDLLIPIYAMLSDGTRIRQYTEIEQEFLKKEAARQMAIKIMEKSRVQIDELNKSGNQLGALNELINFQKYQDEVFKWTEEIGKIYSKIKTDKRWFKKEEELQ